MPRRSPPSDAPLPRPPPAVPPQNPRAIRSRRSRHQTLPCLLKQSGPETVDGGSMGCIRGQRGRTHSTPISATRATASGASTSCPRGTGTRLSRILPADGRSERLMATSRPSVSSAQQSSCGLPLPGRAAATAARRSSSMARPPGSARSPAACREEWSFFLSRGERRAPAPSCHPPLQFPAPSGGAALPAAVAQLGGGGGERALDADQGADRRAGGAVPAGAAHPNSRADIAGDGAAVEARPHRGQ